MLTVATLKKLLEDVPESIETPYGTIPTWVMIRDTQNETASGPQYAHCHVIPGGSPGTPISTILIVPDELAPQKDEIQFEQFKTKGEQ